LLREGKGPTRVKIDFVVPRFSKYGKTTLCALLELRAGVCIRTIKEHLVFWNELAHNQLLRQG
jgi:hypothetical protein